MIEIDGSYGEGGGQVLRTALSLAAILGEDIIISNIRKNRPKPGIKPQHLASIEAIAKICDAEVEGLHPGSKQISFSPLEIRGVDLNIDIGTAGSIPLLIQCIMPAAIYSDTRVKLSIRGGTDVAWSPSVDYLKNVTLKALSKMGYKSNIQVVGRGYYPVGNGLVKMEIEPSKLKGHDFEKVSEKVSGISHCSNLPEHVAERQASSAAEILQDAGFECDVETECTDYISTGSGITLWSGLAGSVSLGKRGLPAEKVGAKAAMDMLGNLKSKAAVDEHLSDQLIPFLGLAGEGSLTTGKLSGHSRTNIWLTEQLLDIKFDIEKIEKMIRISVR
ncbi:RNA 3'-terminal phosphate cyclase [Methanolobus sp. ZRKC3]|uniref:RNA 3'-terminal phosphate cyclase n=1 Tax=Methanolobus sp. ZRKC3 TaxID=3125786 RepID=UPI00324ABFC5